MSNPNGGPGRRASSQRSIWVWLVKRQAPASLSEINSGVFGNSVRDDSVRQTVHALVEKGVLAQVENGIGRAKSYVVIGAPSVQDWAGANPNELRSVKQNMLFALERAKLQVKYARQDLTAFRRALRKFEPILSAREGAAHG